MNFWSTKGILTSAKEQHKEESATAAAAEFIKHQYYILQPWMINYLCDFKHQQLVRPEYHMKRIQLHIKSQT